MFSLRVNCNNLPQEFWNSHGRSDMMRSMYQPVDRWSPRTVAVLNDYDIRVVKTRISKVSIATEDKGGYSMHNDGFNIENS